MVVTLHEQRERGKVISVGVHIGIYIGLFVGQFFFNRTLAIDSPLQ